MIISGIHCIRLHADRVVKTSLQVYTTQISVVCDHKSNVLTGRSPNIVYAHKTVDVGLVLRPTYEYTYTLYRFSRSVVRSTTCVSRLEIRRRGVLRDQKNSTFHLRARN